MRNIKYYYINVQKDLFKIKKTFFAISKLKIIFLTGTNGKTSIAYGSHLLFSLNGMASCYLGTIGFFINGKKIKNLPNTTPSYLQLSSLIHDAEKQKIDSERSEDRKSQVGSGDRSERIRTYNFPQGRVTDHRINLTLHKLEEFMEGEIFDEMVDSLNLRAQEDELKNLEK